MNATIFDIERNSFVDGPGIRTTVFFKGCNLRCAWCHNPESQSADPQMMWYRDKCTGCGKCKEKCKNDPCTLCGNCTFFCPVDARKICGKDYTVDEVLREVLRDKPFYDNSGGGVTCSGGECMLQIDFLAELLKRCKENDLHTAVDTAGHLPFEYFERVLPYTDLFLYDLKLFDPQKHKQYVGVDNARILQNLECLFKAGAKIWIRIPVIAGVNDTVDEIQRIKDFLDRCGTPEKVELLPYHAMGENKYRALGGEPTRFAPPDPDRLQELKQIIKAE